MLYSRTLLLIHPIHNSLICKLQSQILSLSLPWPPPTCQTQVCSLRPWVCFLDKFICILFFLRFQMYMFFKIPDVCDIIQCLSFPLWCTSLSKIISRSSMLLQMALPPSFLWLSNTPLYIYIYIYIATSSLPIPLVMVISTAFIGMILKCPFNFSFSPVKHVPLSIEMGHWETHTTAEQ